MDFNKGMKVEVCSNEEGFRGAWFEGTVVSNEGGGIYKVQHEKFENKRGKPLVEDIHFTQIRPRPPKLNLKNWKVNDHVEIYDTHCWWRGIVSELLPDGYYSVNFPEYGENVYCKSAMRVVIDVKGAGSSVIDVKLSGGVVIWESSYLGECKASGRVMTMSDHV